MKKPFLQKKKTLDNTSFADTAKIAKANKAYAVASHKEALAEIDAYEKKGASNRFKHLTEKYKSKGYDAIRDINDKSFSGYGSKDPIVVFAKDKVDVSRVSQLPKDFIESNNQKAMNEIMVRNLAPAFAAVPAAAALKKGLTSNNDKPAQDFIKEYKHEHPNTKMSNSQILKSVTGGK